MQDQSTNPSPKLFLVVIPSYRIFTALPTRRYAQRLVDCFEDGLFFEAAADTVVSLPFGETIGSSDFAQPCGTEFAEPGYSGYLEALLAYHQRRQQATFLN